MAFENNKDTGYAWVKVVAVFLINMITDGFAYSSGILFVGLIDEFGESRGYTGTVGAVLMGTMCLTGPLVSALSKRLDIRVVVVMGSLIGSVAIAISYFATSVTFLCILFGIPGGVGLGMAYVAANLCILQSFDKRLALANGLTVCGTGAGTVMFTQVLPVFFELYGLRGTMLIMSGIILNGVVCGLPLRPLTVVKAKGASISSPHKDITNAETNNCCQQGRTIQEEGGQKNEYQQGVGVFPNVRKDQNTGKTKLDTQHTLPTTSVPRNKKFNCRYINIFSILLNDDLARNVRFWLFLSSTTLFVFSFNNVFVLLADQVELGGMTRWQSSLLISVLGICNTLGRVVFGILGNLKPANRMHMKICLMLIAGTMTIASSWMSSFELKMVYVVIFGLSIGGYVMFAFTVQVDLFGAENVPDTFGGFMVTVGIAGLIAPPIGGSLYDVTGSYHPSFIVAGTASIVAAFIFTCTVCRRTTASYNLEILT